MQHVDPLANPPAAALPSASRLDPSVGWRDGDDGHARIDAPISVDFTHRLRFTRDLFDPANPILREIVELDPESPRRVLVVVDAGVARARPDLDRLIEAYSAAHPGSMRLVSRPIVVEGGEDAKNTTHVLDEVHTAIHLRRICRRSYVLAIGGGAMLDAVGLAAATAHRGVRIIRVPTTTLAQDDAAVGVKNGINLFGKKNYFGTFAVPWAVLNDERFLDTLPDREFLAGLSEIVKVALVKDGGFFEWIEREAERLAAREMPFVGAAIRRSAELHLGHIVSGGDPFEVKEARPLDFGHWSAHRLEQETRFALRHGEAVAIGVALDTLYSARTGRIDGADALRVLRCLRAMRLPISHPKLLDPEVLRGGLEDFREHLGGRVTISVLDRLGAASDVHVVDIDTMVACAEELAAFAESAAGA
ncbi:MAG TPA: 3-dehydroquinate synthase [Phycisphaerales bacterium]|nr:3-dehydroquinate synthase [Phycisphaerales bacterium]HMP36068.1 3-dehydroquinate synthase [Phycisphaerales bacterium]